MSKVTKLDPRWRLLAAFCATASLLEAQQDADVDGDTLTICSIEPPRMGTALDNGQGGIAYTRTQGKYGTDSFEYTVSDGVNVSAPATVDITVRPVAIAGIVWKTSKPC